MRDTVRIGIREVGEHNPCFIIAEAGVNHNGDLQLARHLVDVAAAAGADAVKFQTFKATGVASSDAPKAAYQHATTDGSESQLQMLRRLELSLNDHRELMNHCRERNILFMSTPFDYESADILSDLDMPVTKVGSGEVNNLPFLSHVAKKGKPVILSTGMSYLGEVDRAIQTILATGNDKIILLHCVTNYPADPADANLKAMQTMASAFRCPVGYSDHTEGMEIPIAAVALGASVIEKHITLDRNLPGPDHASSMEPDAFESLVAKIRIVEAGLGLGEKRPATSEAETRKIVRRSLAVCNDVETGAILREGDLTALRPGTGIPPEFVGQVVGRRLARSVDAGSLLTWNDLI